MQRNSPGLDTGSPNANNWIILAGNYSTFLTSFFFFFFSSFSFMKTCNKKIIKVRNIYKAIKKMKHQRKMSKQLDTVQVGLHPMPLWACPNTTTVLHFHMNDRSGPRIWHHSTLMRGHALNRNDTNTKCTKANIRTTGKYIRNQ